MWAFNLSPILLRNMHRKRDYVYWNRFVAAVDVVSMRSLLARYKLCKSESIAHYLVSTICRSHSLF